MIMVISTLIFPINFLRRVDCVCVAILHLGNINFEDNGASVAKIHEEDGSQRSLEHAAELLAVTSMQLQTVLLEREIMKKNQEDRTM